MSGFKPTEALIGKIEGHLKNCKGLSAWQLIQELPPLKEWRGYEGRRSAGRLSRFLGDSRVGSVIDFLNWRENREQPGAYFNALFSRATIKPGAILIPEIESYCEALDHELEAYHDIQTFLASCYANLREFDKAHRLFDRGISLSKEPAWHLVQRAVAYTREDRFEDALAAVEEARAMDRYYQPVVDLLVISLTNLGFDERAEEVLLDAVQFSDHPDSAFRLANLYSERDDVDRTEQWILEYEKRSPLLSEAGRKSLYGRYADVAYLREDIAKYIEFGKKTGEGSFHQKCISYLKENKSENGVRKRLEVEFVKQHDMTCAPATLAALSRYFGKEYDHLEIVEAICYDGTPWHKEREWCESHGFSVREFSVTMESAKQLIDAEIPFSLTTEGVDWAHLQACIGYDERLGTLLLRDPTHRHYGEVILTLQAESQPVRGLRGLAMVPLDRKETLMSLRFEGEMEYDLYHAFGVALDSHRVKDAELVLEDFVKKYPDSPLRYYSEARLASYKDHSAAELIAIESLHKRFPKDQSLWIYRLNLLNQLTHHNQAREFLEKIRKKKNYHPLFDTEAGELLGMDIRTSDTGSFYLKRALRRQPSEGRIYAAYSRCQSLLGNAEDAARFLRIASQFSRSFEPYAQQYYEASLAIRKEDEALQYLEKRAEFAGEKNVEPHLTILNILWERDHKSTPEYAARLLQKFPSDGKLLLKIVSIYSGWDRRDEALRYLENARGSVPEQEWCRIAAQFSGWTGDRDKAVVYWHNLLGMNPLAIDAYQAIARHLSEEGDQDDSISFLKEAHQKNPDYLPLAKIYAEWLDSYGPQKVIPVLVEILKKEPNDIWVIREIALKHSENNNYELAQKFAQQALAQDPRDSLSHSVFGHVHSRAGEIDQALSSYRKALEISVDNVSAFHGLWREGDSHQARREFLAFIREEMVSQVSNGDIVPEYRTFATGMISNHDLQEDLELFHGERPDLWQTWATLRTHLSLHRNSGEGIKLAIEFTTEFPLLPRAWAELGFANQLEGQWEDAISAFEKAIALSPSWDWVLRELSSVQEKIGEYDSAIHSLDRILKADPLNVAAYGYKADLLWKLDRRKEALDVLNTAILISPTYQWGWSSLIQWTRKEDCEFKVNSLIEKISPKRSHQYQWWRQLCSIHRQLDNDDEAFTSIEKGLSLHPENIDLVDEKVICLIRLGKHTEALGLCRETRILGERPRVLRGREAWILMRSGKSQEGWELMKALSEEEKDYSFAHDQLAEWAYERKEWSVLKEAAERLIAVSPDDSESYGVLGRAEEQLGNTKAARKAYDRALNISDGYLFAARRKATLEKEVGEYDEARDTLLRIRHHHRTSYILADLILVRLSEGREDAESEIPVLWDEASMIAAENDEDPFVYLESEFKQQKRISEFDRILFDRVNSLSLSSEAEARAWGRRIVSSTKRKKLLKGLTKVDLAPALKASAIAEVVNAGDSAFGKKVIPQLIVKNESLLSQYAGPWLQILEYYGTHHLEMKACEWGMKWRDFGDEINASSLTLYAACVDDRKGLTEGLALRQEVMDRFPQWEGSLYQRICLAFHEAAEGRSVEAEALVLDFDERETSDFYHAILLQMRAMVSAHQGDEAQAQKFFGEAGAFVMKFSEDQAAKRYFEYSAEIIAKTLPVFKGRGSKVIKNWGHNAIKKSSGFSWWNVFWILWVIKVIYSQIND